MSDFNLLKQCDIVFYFDDKTSETPRYQTLDDNAIHSMNTKVTSGENTFYH